MRNRLFTLTLISIVLLALNPKSSTEETGLKDAFKNHFLIGAAVNNRQVSGMDQAGLAVLGKHFSSITSENLLKWGPVNPMPGVYNFTPADQFVEMGEKMGAFIVGHTLVWHQQTPDWVFENDKGELLGKMDLIARMEAHIENVAGRYKGRIHGWDVANEVFFDDGQYRTSKWYNAAGKDFIKAAFRKADQVDPKAELYYNDYNMWKPEKREAANALAKEMRAEGIKIDGIGMQGHYRLDSPSLDQIEASIVAIAAAGFRVMFTELDIDVLPSPANRQGADLDATFANDEKYNPYKNGLPQEVQDRLAKRYAELFALFAKHSDKISRVTFWGVTDGGSWLNNWPVKGRTAYPLPFDRDYKEKKDVMHGILGTAK